MGHIAFHRVQPRAGVQQSGKPLFIAINHPAARVWESEPRPRAKLSSATGNGTASGASAFDRKIEGRRLPFPSPGGEGTCGALGGGAAVGSAHARSHVQAPAADPPFGSGLPCSPPCSRNQQVCLGEVLALGWAAWLLAAQCV